MSSHPPKSAQRRAKVFHAGDGMRLNLKGIVFSYKAGEACAAPPPGRVRCRSGMSKDRAVGCGIRTADNFPGSPRHYRCRSNVVLHDHAAEPGLLAMQLERRKQKIRVPVVRSFLTPALQQGRKSLVHLDCRLG